LQEEARQLVKTAVQFAEDSPFPAPEEAFEDLFCEMEGVKTNG